MNYKRQRHKGIIAPTPILLTKSKINRTGYKFLSTFAKNGQSNLAPFLVAESKGPYYNFIFLSSREVIKVCNQAIFQRLHA